MAIHSYPTTSIAVLPFKNISPSQNLNYFAVGFTEDLITDLSRYSSLQVISSHSSGRISGNQDDAELIRSLKAEYLVSGNFRQKGEELRINAQLILSGDQRIVWSHRYDANLDALFEIQDDITEQLVSALQRQIDINLLSASKNKVKTSLAAYEYWLMGMEELKKGNVEADNAGRELFQQALEIDPNYARAYSGLSLSYFNEWSCQLWERWDYSQKGAFEYAQKAIDLDDTNYIGLTVLGRLYIYKGDWEKAEHLLRKSLKINPNDADNIIQIASCFIYFGYLKEAEMLYLKALKLNPINTDWYFSFGSILYFELGEFDKSVELGRKTDLDSAVVDMANFIAAAYFHLGDHDNKLQYWNKYLEIFKKKILRGNDFIELEALQWVVNVNPSKQGSNLDPYVAHMEKLIGEGKLVIKPEENDQLFKSQGNYFRLNGDLWEMQFEGQSSIFAESKGFHDLLKLISEPSREIHCAELMGIPVVVEDAPLVLDDQSKKEYKNRLAELQSDLADAEEMNDLVRASLLQTEYDQIVDHLSKSLGLSGKSRKLSGSVEKARSAVTWRIRSAIKKIKGSNASLGNHLDNAIKTGTFCSYSPDKEVKWN